MSVHPLSCECGTLQGKVATSGALNRAICYCRDCQAFAHALGRPNSILDEHGGSEVVAASPAAVTFTHGLDSLACLSLTPKGLLRWYASCCNTPIGNTPRNFKLAYVGLLHNCLKAPGGSLDAFGPVRLWVNTASAKGRLPPIRQHLFLEVLRVMAQLARRRLDGSYRNTPFFSAQGQPIASPRLLPRDEVESARRAAQG